MRKRIPRVQDVVAQPEIRVSAPLGEAGTRDDLDHHPTGIVIVGSK